MWHTCMCVLCVYVWVRGWCDREQTWPHGIRLGLDKSDLIEVRANASTQVLITADDTCFPAAGGWAAVDEARPAYSALGGSLEVYTAVWHHGWVLPTRERISGYFCDEFASTKYGYSLCTVYEHYRTLTMRSENAALIVGNNTVV
eukprot:m.1149971 g.1149971  ORF g.1149971 m.1149971 type:complete len:145 (-) comp24476_c0_seq84:2639-3073(-)